MTKQRSTQVLIVGGGPVGLTLAIDLAQRGVEVLLLEMRPRGQQPRPKSNHVSARTMEIFRRLGVVGQIRNAGLPADYPNDVAYRTTFVGKELSRIPIPARRDRYTATGGPDTWWPTPEPPHRINQIFMEPVLNEFARATPRLTILDHIEFVDFDQDDHGVVACTRDLHRGEELEVRCQYLVGCDGGRSSVRKQIGATLTGTAVVGRVQSTYIRAPDLLGMAKSPRAWATFSLNPRRSGNVYAIDGLETFVVFNYLKPEETSFDDVDRDWGIRTILGVDSSFRYEVISREDWIARRLVADKFREKRVFICGDASHLWVPMAGYGMNAGIADAMDLSWQLGGVIQGWGGDGLLDAFEAERLPITDQVSKFAMNHALAFQKEREAVPGNIEADGPEGDLVRARVGQALYDLNVKQYCCAGLNFGYYYDKSPVIAYDGADAPSYTMDTFTPSTVPGCRLPHVWLEGGKSIYDELGPGFTLARRDPDVDVGEFTTAAGIRNVPLKLLDIPSNCEGGLQCEKLILVRPDQHIAWRGNKAPIDALALIDLVRGARKTEISDSQ